MTASPDEEGPSPPPQDPAATEMLPVTYLNKHKAGQSLMERSGGGGGRHVTKAAADSLLKSALALLGLVLLCFEAYKLAGGRSPAPIQPYSLSTLGGQRNRRQLAARHPAPHLRTLVLVACHSVYTGLDFKHPEDQSSWLLLDYQKVPGQAHSFVQHIELGVEQAAADPEALLLFSGGKTRRDAGPRAESMGYWLVAEANKWFGHPNVRGRAYTEEHARDSFENLLFGLCRFYELTGHYPSALVVVGYEFKRERFAELHRAALNWPAQRFDYVGTPALTPGAAVGEARTAAAFEGDPYGCRGELAEKRAKRDPFADGGYSGERCPAMAELLKHCGPEVFKGQLPWGASSHVRDEER